MWDGNISLVGISTKNDLKKTQADAPYFYFFLFFSVFNNLGTYYSCEASIGAGNRNCHWMETGGKRFILNINFDRQRREMNREELKANGR